jgi:large subunit ribosomal protein L7/L12
MSDKIQKIVDQVSELSVMEVADLVKSLEEKFGVTAAVSVAAGPSAAAAGGEAAEAKDSFNVILVAAGGQKIPVIQALRAINPNLGLKKAKDLSEKPNAEILTGVNKATAEEAKAKLVAAGATVELK